MKRSPCLNNFERYFSMHRMTHHQTFRFPELKMNTRVLKKIMSGYKISLFEATEKVCLTVEITKNAKYF